MLRIFTLSLFILVVWFPASGQRKKSSPSQSKVDMSRVASLKFRNLTPALTSGRISDIEKDPRNKNIWYVGTSSGNIWKTVNAGTTWKPVFENYGSYSIGSIAIDPNNHSVIWAGTGENNSQRSVGYGDGIYKSQDAGNTWKNMGLNSSEHIAKIIVDPSNSNIVYVASQGSLWKDGGDRGVFKTTDEGASWSRVLHFSDQTGAADLMMDPRDPNVLYASSYQRRRHFGILVAGGPEGAIYKSIDGGANWKQLKNGLPNGIIGRIGIAISPIDPDVLYAIVGQEVRDGGFYRSSDRGESWQKQSDYMVVDAQYYMELFPDPHKFDKVYSVDMRLHVTENGGKSFERVNNRGKHVDNHEIVFDNDDPNYIMVGCDGGIYESWDSGDSWSFIDNMPITQFYRVGIDNDTPFYNVYGGTQDNNTIGGPSQNTNISGISNADWFFTLGGDGFQTRIDPGDPNILYSQYQYAGLVRFDKRTGERVELQPQPGKGEAPLRWNWDAPLLISPHKKERLYYAANKLFKSEDRGSSWQVISPDLTKQLDRNQMEVMGKVWSIDAPFKNVFTSPLGSIVAFDESPIQEGLLIVGTDDGLIQITADGGSSWNQSGSLPSLPELAYCSDVFASRHDVNEIFAVFNYHKYGDYRPFVFRSGDQGKTWNSISSNLPNDQFGWSIYQDHIDPNLLFLGTEFGLFVSGDKGASWTGMKNGLPTIPIRDIEIQKREDDLVLASFGRGFYILDDYSPLRNASTLSGNVLYPVKEALLYQELRPQGGSRGNQVYYSDNPNYGATFTYHLADSYASKEQQRKKLEEQNLKLEKPNSYPSWEDLESENREQQIMILIDISDSNGDFIRRISGPSRKGTHRISWDLRMIGSGQVTGNRNPSGPFVLDGKYMAKLKLIHGGVITDLGQSQEFTVKRLLKSSIEPASMSEVIQFNKQVAELMAKSDRANRFLIKADADMVGVIQKVLNTHPNPEAVIKQVGDMRAQVFDLIKIISGQRIRNSRAELVPASIQSRVRRAADFWGSTTSYTKTHKEQYDIAKSEFDGLVPQLEQLKNELKSLYSDLSDYGLQWTELEIIMN